MRAWLLVVALAGCVGDAGFHCASDDQCGAGGFCETTGYCSFTDGSCTQGRRYGAHAGASSNLCVGEGQTCGTVEICNGLDDDCNGVIDDGCPDQFDFTDQTTLSPLYGSLTGDTGTTSFDDRCPTGQVFVGAAGTIASRIDHLQMICGILTVAADTTTAPYGYHGAIAAGMTLPLHGMYPSAAFNLPCPPDNVVIGVSGQATAGGSTGGGVAELHLTCAPIAITGMPGNFSLSYGATSIVKADGGYSYNPFTVPGGGGVFDHITGLSGAHIDWVEFGDRTLSVSLIPGK